MSADWPLLSRRAIEVLVRAARHDGPLLRHYRRSFAGSESFLATVLMNEPGLSVSREDRRFLSFAGPGVPHPDVLTSHHLDELADSGTHFARRRARLGSVLCERRGGFSAPPHKESTLSGAMARGDVRIAVTLACEECKRRNYQSQKSKRNDPDRIELRKYCRWCGKHTPHKETR